MLQNNANPININGKQKLTGDHLRRIHLKKKEEKKNKPSHCIVKH